MLANLEKELPKIPDAAAGCAACGHDGHGHAHSGVKLGWAILGGILVLNSYVAKVLFPNAIDPYAVELSAIAGAMILGVPIIVSAVHDLLRGRVFMNELVALALIAAFAQAEYRTAGAVAFFMLLTISLERRTAIGAEASIEELIRLTPRRARRVSGEDEEEVEVLELKPGDVCLVRPGENFPADGTIATGASSVNQSSITGESLPVDKVVNDEVYAGTQNLTGAVRVRVSRVGTDTTLGQVRELIVAAEKSKLPIMRMIDRYVGFYTPTVLMIAALVWAFTHDMTRVIAVLVMSCPCALVVAAPSAVIAAIAAAARLGLLIKDVAHIEIASRIRAVIFDKTGTLTEGRLEVARLNPAPDVELADLLLAATSTECHSNHPAAQAMRRLAEEAGVKWEQPTEYEEVAGIGVVAKFGDDVTRVGRAMWLKECGINVDSMTDGPDEDQSAAMSVVYVAKNDKILGWIGLRDAVRSAARDAVQELKDLGVRHCCMFTGDNRKVAELVAERVGISEFRADCLPQEKVAYVEELKREGGLVAVVGDGVNDAPALAAGDVSVAMGAIGSDVAIQSASVALLNNDLRRVPFLIRLSRRARLMMNQNWVAGLLFIGGGLYLSTIGKITPVAAAILHSAGTLVVIFNSARLVRSGEKLQETTPVA